MAETRVQRLAVLGMTIGAKEAVVHARIMYLGNATCMALAGYDARVNCR